MVDATDLVSTETLNLSGSSTFDVNNVGDGVDVDASLSTGLVDLATDADASLTVTSGSGAFGNTKVTSNGTGTITVNAAAQSANDVVLVGSSAFAVTGVDNGVDVNASAATDTVSVTTDALASGNALAVTTGTANTTVATGASNSGATVTVAGANLDGADTLFLTGGAGFQVNGLTTSGVTVSSSATGTVTVNAADMGPGGGAETLNLAGSASYVLENVGANVTVDATSATGAVDVTTGFNASLTVRAGTGASGNLSVTSNGVGTITVDATNQVNNKILLDGSSSYDVSSAAVEVVLNDAYTGTGLVKVTTADVAAITVDFGASVTGSREVDASAMTSGDLLTLKGAEDVSLSSTDADITATSLSGALTATVTNTDDLTLTVGSGTTDVIALGNDGTKTLTVNASSAGGLVTLDDEGGAKAGDTSITNLGSNGFTLKDGYVGTGDLSVTTSDASMTIALGNTVVFEQRVCECDCCRRG